MLRVALVLLAVLLTVAALAGAGGAASPAAATKAQLRVAALRPLAVVGIGFRAGETVRVTANTDDGVGARTVKAGAAGRLGVRFPTLTLRRCPMYVISARGNRGSRATLRSVPYPCGIDP